MIYFFDYIRKNGTDKESKISRFYFDLMQRTIYRRNYKDNVLSDEEQVMESDVTLRDFKHYRSNKVNLSSLANVTKIKGDKPLKRNLFKKDGKIFCKESDDKAFEYEDSLLEEKEKNYTIIMGE